RIGVAPRPRPAGRTRLCMNDPTMPPQTSVGKASAMPPPAADPQGSWLDASRGGPGVEISVYLWRARRLVRGSGFAPRPPAALPRALTPRRRRSLPLVEVRMKRIASFTPVAVLVLAAVAMSP